MRQRLAAALGAAASAVTVARPAALAAQQGAAVIVTPPASIGDTLRSVTPSFFVQGVGLGAARPLRVRLEIDTSARFVAPVLAQELVTSDTALTLVPTRALNGGLRVFWRVLVTEPNGVVRTSAVGGPRRVPSWISPLLPSPFSGTVVGTRRPTFAWRSPAVSEPPGPWEYTLEITNLGQLVRTVTLVDTVYRVPAGGELEANATHRWTVTARLRRSGQSEAVSVGTFTVIDDSVRISTLFYQNFPNPFPAGGVQNTCLWIDIGEQARVELDVYSLRGTRVRRLLPNAALGDVLGVGRYGRARPGTAGSCDPNFEWDGRDDAGRTVPAGVYLLRFRAGSVTSVRKVVFRGRG